jgi:transcriptional regulator with XRE-family HTH domain
MTEADIAAVLALNAQRLLDERGWTKAELSRRLKTHQSNVGRLLTGHYAPSAKTIAAVATVFEVEVCDILCPPKPVKKSKKA